MLKKYSVSVLAAAVAASVSVTANANDALEVVDLGTAPDAYVTFPGGMNELGEAVVVNRELWQQNIRYDLLTQEVFGELDFDNLTDAQYRSVRNLLNNPQGFAGNPEVQKLATQVSHIFDGSARFLLGFDELDAETNEFTDSVNVVANAINDAGFIVGSAGEAYQRRDTTDREGEPVRYFMRDSYPRAFVYREGEVTFLPSDPLEGEEVFQGGTGSAFAINQNNQIVGRAAVANSVNLNARLVICQTPPEEEGAASAANEELNVCVWRFWNTNEVLSVAQGSNRAPIFIEQAHLWQLNDDASVEAVRLGGFERLTTITNPEDEDDVTEQLIPLPSRALDINNQGIAVGAAQRVVDFTNANGQVFPNITVTSSVAFRDGDIIPLQQEFRAQTSEATGINDNNIAVGYSILPAGSASRSRAYWVDLNSDSPEMVYPTGFFNTSSWRPRAVNNQNVMVGQAEVTAEIAQQRRTVGFMYDIHSNAITDLNTLLPCNSGYRIVDAYDINDRGEILALATTSVAIPVDGEDDVAARLRAVRLQAGSGSACGEGAGEDVVERKGASVHPIVAGVMALFALLITRRRMKRA